MVFMYFLQIARIQSIFNHPFKDWEKIQTQGYNRKSKGFENKTTGLILLCHYYMTNYLSCSSDQPISNTLESRALAYLI